MESLQVESISRQTAEIRTCFAGWVAAMPHLVEDHPTPSTRLGAACRRAIAADRGLQVNLELQAEAPGMPLADSQSCAHTRRFGSLACLL